MSRQLFFRLSPPILKRRMNLRAISYVEDMSTTRIKPYSEPLAPKLYIVPMPIGNFEDVTIRSLRVLASADWIAVPDRDWCEWFLGNFGIERNQSSMLTFGDFNEFERTPTVLEKLRGGQSVALITKRGYPNLSDHGEILIGSCIGISIQVEALPGATAFLPALLASGIRTHRFIFEGKLPRDKKGRPAQRWHDFASEKRSIIFYEDSEGVIKLLEEMCDHLGRHRQVVIAKDLSTKQEKFFRGLVGKVLDEFYRNTSLQGQYVVILQGTRNPINLKAKEQSIKHEQRLLSREGKLIAEYEKLARQRKEINDWKVKVGKLPATKSIASRK